LFSVDFVNFWQLITTAQKGSWLHIKNRVAKALINPPSTTPSYIHNVQVKTAPVTGISRHYSSATMCLSVCLSGSIHSLHRLPYLDWFICAVWGLQVHRNQFWNLSSFTWSC